MRRGYIRVRQDGPDAATQRQSLVIAGVFGTIHVDDGTDDLPRRSEVISDLRSGDELVVHDAATIGISADDILGALVAISRRSAILYVVATGKSYRLRPDNTAKARKRLAELGGHRKVTAKVRARALEIWSDSRVRSAKEVSAILHREGIEVSVRTLYYNLPSRRAAIKQTLEAQ